MLDKKKPEVRGRGRPKKVIEISIDEVREYLRKFVWNKLKKMSK